MAMFCISGCPHFLTQSNGSENSLFLFVDFFEGFFTFLENYPPKSEILGSIQFKEKFMGNFFAIFTAQTFLPHKVMGLGKVLQANHAMTFK